MAGTRRKQQVWQQQRAQILAAAAALFGRTGADGPTMADVARHANVAVGTLYKFFPSKQALHMALFEERAAAILAYTLAAPDPAAPAAAPAAENAAPLGNGVQKAAGAEELLAEETWPSWLDKEPERRERSQQARRAEILAAAAAVFQRCGFGGAAMADIAASAGVATGTLYNFFESKEALFASLIEETASSLFGELAAAVEPNAPVAAKVAQLMGAACAFFADKRAFLHIYLSAGSGFDLGARQDAGAGFQQQYAAFLAWVADTLAGGMAEGSLRRMDARELAQILVGMLNAALLAWTRDDYAGPLAARGERVTELFLDGARCASCARCES